MHFNTLPLALLSLGAVFTAAAPSGLEERFPHKPPHARTQCFTSRGTTKPTGAIRTKYFTHYLTCTATVTAPTTATVTSVSVTDSVVTSTTSTTVTAGTTTISTTDGFVPVQSSMPGSGYTGSGGSIPDGDAETPDLHQLSKGKTSPNPRYGLQLSARRKKTYAEVVVCYVYKQKCATTATVTATSTVVSASVSMTTTITTETISIPAATVYAQCLAADNYADEVNGNSIPTGGNNDSVFETTADSAYDCCNAAATMPGNTIFVYFSGNCEVAYADSCGAQSQDQNFVHGDPDDQPYVTWGNGPCGENIYSGAFSGGS